MDIRFEGASPAAVYSIQGRKIASLKSGAWKADVAPGIYLIRGGNAVKRLAVLQ